MLARVRHFAGYLGDFVPTVISRRMRTHYGVTLVLGCVGILVFGYLAYQFSYLVGKPGLILQNPRYAYIEVGDPFIDIGGTLREEARLLINRRPVLVTNGGFHERLYLSSGLNKIDVEAINLQGRLALRQLFVVYNP